MVDPITQECPREDDGDDKTIDDCRAKFGQGQAFSGEPHIPKDPLEPYASWDDAKRALDSFVGTVVAARERFGVPDVVIAFGFSYFDEARSIASKVGSISFGDPMHAEMLATKAMAVAGDVRRRRLDLILRAAPEALMAP